MLLQGDGDREAARRPARRKRTHVEWTDWLVSVALILLVIRQLRGRRLSLLSLLWPVALVAWAGVEYLGAVAPYASDRLLVGGLGAVGVGLGLACGFLTHVHARDGIVVARASWLAAVTWILGMAGRLAFGLVALNGGEALIADLSIRLDLHAIDTWPTALITMALAEVIARTCVLFVKHRAVTRLIEEGRAHGRIAALAEDTRPRTAGGPVADATAAYGPEAAAPTSGRDND
jgi:hypothetical protein